MTQATNQPTNASPKIKTKESLGAGDISPTGTCSHPTSSGLEQCRERSGWPEREDGAALRTLSLE